MLYRIPVLLPASGPMWSLSERITGGPNQHPRRRMVDASVELLDVDSRGATPVNGVVNRGDHAITLPSLRVTVQDDDGIPDQRSTVCVATLLTIDSNRRGPLLPGSTRRFAQRF